MEIGPVRPELFIKQLEGQKEKQEAASTAKPATDKVDISLEARQRLAELVTTPAGNSEEVAETEDSDKLQLIKLRVNTGYYERPDIKAAIADKLTEYL